MPRFVSMAPRHRTRQQLVCCYDIDAHQESFRSHERPFESSENSTQKKFRRSVCHFCYFHHTMNASWCRCNNLGVDLYRQGRLIEARAAFRCAAKLLQPVACGLHHSDKPPTANNVEEDELFISQTYFDLLAQEEEYEEIHWLTETDESMFFAREAQLVDIKDGDVFSSVLTSAKIIMNIGLTYLFERSVKSRLTALNLFDIAYILIIAPPNTDLHSESVALTCLNNAAQIQFSLGNHDISQKYYETLVLVLRKLPIVDEQARKAFRGRFMLNAVIMQDTTAARAA